MIKLYIEAHRFVCLIYKIGINLKFRTVSYQKRINEEADDRFNFLYIECT